MKSPQKGLPDNPIAGHNTFDKLYAPSYKDITSPEIIPDSIIYADVTDYAKANYADYVWVNEDYAEHYWTRTPTISWKKEFI